MTRTLASTRVSPPAIAGFPGRTILLPDGLSKEIQADAILRIGRARMKLGDQVGARAACQTALDAIAEINSSPEWRTTLYVGVAQRSSRLATGMSYASPCDRRSNPLAQSRVNREASRNPTMSRVSSQTIGSEGRLRCGRSPDPDQGGARAPRPGKPSARLSRRRARSKNLWTRSRRR